MKDSLNCSETTNTSSPYRERSMEGDIIDVARFPLMVLVLFIHVAWSAGNYQIVPGFSMDNLLYNYPTFFISHVFGEVAVPTFFFISGYLYFVKFREFSWDWYATQQKKRIRSLLIPYLLWNTIYWLGSYLMTFLLFKIGRVSPEEWHMASLMSPFRAFWSGPADLPLWYLRELVIMTFCSPLFYFVFRFLGRWSVPVLIAFYVQPWFDLPVGVGATSILFFGLGSYCGLNRLPFAEYLDRYGVWITLFVLSCMFVITYMGDKWHGYLLYLMKVATILGVGVALWGAKKALAYPAFLRIAGAFSSSIFFIYAFHTFYVLGWIRGAFYRLPYVDLAIVELVYYFAMGVVLLLVCYFVFLCLRKVSPRILELLCGGRV